MSARRFRSYSIRVLLIQLCEILFRRNVLQVYAIFTDANLNRKHVRMTGMTVEAGTSEPFAPSAGKYEDCGSER